MSDVLTKVIFRYDREHGDVFAVFPEEPSTYNPWEFTIYARLGQHGSGTHAGCFKRGTRLATVSERTSLEKELKSLGYNLQVITRYYAHMRLIREAKIHRVLHEATTPPQLEG